MKKYCVVGIAALALLYPAEGHIHNHRSGQLHRDLGARACPKETQTTTLTIQVDEFGHTLGTGEAKPSTPVHQETTPSSVSSTAAAAATTASFSSASTTTPLPQAPPSQASSQLESGRYVLPQATDLSQLSHANPLDTSFVPDTSNQLLGNKKNKKYGISYSPYNGDGTCKTQEEVDSDMRQLRQFAYARFYGVDCNQAQTITNSARKNNMQVFAGVFDIENMEEDLQSIIDAADGDWSTFHTVSIGNELVNRGQSSPAEIVGAVNSARRILREAGYQGPVVTVDTFNQIIAHPELCDASDYCAANCHAFFDPTQTPENAGPYVLEQARQVSQATKDGDKKVIITETGWPTAGEANGAAVPGEQNQMVALKSLQQSFPDGGIVLFSAFNDKWKQDNAWTFGTEKHWGLLGLSKTAGDAIPGIVNPLDGGGL